MTDIKQRGFFRQNFYLKAFGLGLILAFIMFIPFIIRDGGRFLFYGDFNVQQVPFYTLAHEAVSSGNLGWNQYTDLGANFVGSYSFYLLGSPFFYITLFFPTEFVQYLMGPLLMLKFAFCCLAAFTYLQRYVKNKNYAILGGVLYAFSGFSLFNVFFNHFHEAILIFPFLLWALDEYVLSKRRGVVALFVFASCMMNYYFFVGQVIFCAIYFFVRLLTKSYKISIKDFLFLALECVIGLGMSMMLLLPSIYTILQNYRVSNPINGWSALLYDRNQRYIHILQAMFFPPDLPSRSNFTPDSGSQWASIGLWLPMFGMTGVVAWLQQRKKHWLKKVLYILLLCMLVPVLNSAFQMFNASYYARWFYIPVLMMTLATVLSLESTRVDFKRSITWSVVVISATSLLIGLMPDITEENGTEVVVFGLEKYPTRFWTYVAISVFCLALVVFIFAFVKKENRLKVSLSLVCTVSVVYGAFFIALGKTQSSDPYDHLIPYALNGGKNVQLEDLENTRSDFYESLDNSGMFWGIPTIQAFHSIVPGSIMEFYDFVGVQRDVGSRPEPENYAIRGITSVKWLFDDDHDNDYFGGENYDSPEMPGFIYYGNANGFDIWENEAYIPMGFEYTSYVTESEAADLSESSRQLLMLKTAIVPDEDDGKWAALLPKYPLSDAIFTEEEYLDDCKERASSTATDFTYTNTGFTAKSNADESRVLFFSVPIENGWSAYVNGAPSEILKTNIGFMSVVVPAGEEVVIEFRYSTPGLSTGILVSVLSFACFFIYIFVSRKFKNHTPPRKQTRKRGSFKAYCKQMNITITDGKIGYISEIED